MKYWVEYRIKEKRKGTDHYHDFKSHQKKDDDADASTDPRQSFLKILP